MRMKYFANGFFLKGNNSKMIKDIMFKFKFDIYLIIVQNDHELSGSQKKINNNQANHYNVLVYIYKQMYNYYKSDIVIKQHDQVEPKSQKINELIDKYNTA